MTTNKPDDPLSEMAEAVKRRESISAARPVRTRQAAPQVINVYQARDVQTIERTGKKWKAWMLIGAATMILGVLGAIVGVAIATSAASAYGATGAGTPNVAFAGLLLSAPPCCIGFIMFLIGLVGGWWYHR